MTRLKRIRWWARLAFELAVDLVTGELEKPSPRKRPAPPAPTPELTLQWPRPGHYSRPPSRPN